MIKTLLLAGSLAGAGWGAHAYLETQYANKDLVLTMNQQTQFVMDRQMSALIKEIAYLERKENKTQSELEYLRWLREQLKELQRVKSGK